ncbi:NADP-dependent oxidoreductase [Alkalihalobacillus sp. LMS6]|uniref:NADP-dependent oxidoreductase n=1 Tax=Alkalihalobacillus sp. LMS6 TaxID=2924034 RepID=UPI0020D1D01E|nr:NADP-dependent oxidoreductase [Alkalihalobacillus sp. LMS6]UTR08196.1 NADP-dependent oxidoreductase [Alkalihalobacillus sp. LMS6]
MKQQQIQLRERPDGWPNQETFDYKEIDVQQPHDGEVVLKTRYLSVDPYMRGRMNDAKSYVEPFQVGEPLNGGIVAEVVETKSNDLKVGDVVTGSLDWQEYNTVSANNVRKLNLHGAPMSTALGVLGMPGFTAYFGMYHIGEPKEGETVVISGAAGAVGSIAGQLAKRKGARVVGIVGSKEKADYLRSLGFDEAVNYKEDQVGKALEKACPDGIDVYFENVGGEISDQVWPLLNTFARVPVCGAISAYNLEQGEEDIGRRVQGFLVKSRVKMQGFLVGDFQKDFKEAYVNLSQFVQDGELKFEETIHEGIEKVPDAFLGLFKGENIGKQLVKVSE